ncbi:hypothetical protein K505DRAFT_404874 [Melanomma pulvis-pyrius CBS 109.77]|uniref:G protein-coupled glucose receptor regulating Gpa2-domain-containing protein n=1 Tax=Melanomma pulvis-pyrius CBS 109.77 TaxID=1314802 RepID=A0A6A6XRH9_9PLEO|nr:hypothetical protein K505DRAFT_404874 [Melanomma pulvis-pyrius CBS 109.77]
MSNHNGPSSINLYDQNKTFIIQVTTAICAAVSITASLVAFYWFFRMEKRFRHRLIMLLIYGDVMKTSWFFIFAIVSIVRGTVKTSSSFCQASGFFVQYGMETSDYSVLVIAIHSAMQVFRPSALASSDGLRPFRYYVYIGVFLVPTFMAGMAFINPHWGYLSQGAFCTLPIRPFWYRLALAWIPRYLIAIIVLGLAVAIYTHVGFEFRNFSQVGHSFDTSIATITPMLLACDVEDATAGNNSEPPKTPEQQVHMNSERRASSVVHEVVASRRGSAVAFVLDNTAESRLNPPGTRSRSVPTNPRNPYPPTAPTSSLISISQALERAAKPASNRTTAPSPSRSHINSRNPSPLSNCPTLQVQRQNEQERARIHRQLRLMFIYPLTYIFMWLIPFVYHCMMYQDKWAAHPVYWLTMLSTICVALMGVVDCLIFSLRERPWRHMPAGDGTFWGSFTCWKRSDASDGWARRARERRIVGSRTSGGRWMPKREICGRRLALRKGTGRKRRGRREFEGLKVVW